MNIPQGLYYLLIILLINVTGLKAQVTDADIKVAYIYRFTDFIDWQIQDKSTSFSIGIFADDKLILKKFKYLAVSRKIKNRKIALIPIQDLNQLKKENLNILYINKKRNNDIINIFALTKGKNTLLVTDNCPVKEAVMINFLPSEKEEVVRFEINKKNTVDEGLITQSDILLLGGTYVDVRKLFQEKEHELEIEKEKLKKSKLELEKQRKLISVQNKEIAEREEILLFKNNKLRSQELKLSINKQVLDSLTDEIEEKQLLLNNKLLVLNKQEEQIKSQQITMLETKSELIKQEQKLDTQELLINRQENIVIEQLSRIQLQQNILYVSLFITVLV